MAESVFHPSVGGGWRDPDPPVATPGVVWRVRTRLPSIGSTTNYAPSQQRTGVSQSNANSPRLAPRYVAGTADVYVSEVRVATSGNVTLRTERRDFTAVNLSAAGRSDLVLIVRVGTNELAVPLSEIPAGQTASPYVWNNTAAIAFAAAVSTSSPATAELALVDRTAGNVDGTEVFEVEPRYVPFSPVAEPVSMFDEAALDAPGLVWRHTRRTLISSTAPVAVVNAGRLSVVEPANTPIPPAYVTGGLSAYVTRLDFAANEVRLIVQSAPTNPRTLSADRSLILEGLTLVLRPRGASNVRWSLDLDDFEPGPGDVPGIYTFRVVPPLIFRTALPLGAVVAALVDRRNPNVDLPAYRFRRLTAVADDYTVEFFSRSVGVRMMAVASVRRAADTDIPVRFLSRAEVTMTAAATVTPYTGETPAMLPAFVEVREIPPTGSYRGRRWVDHTDDFAALAWTREIGSIGSAEGEITRRDWPEGVYTAGAPEYIGRAISQRFLAAGDLALTFPAGGASTGVRVGELLVVDGAARSPVNSAAEFEVISRSSRGAQRLSVFEGGDVGSASVSGIRLRTSGLALSGRLPLGDITVQGVTCVAVTLFTASVALDYSGATTSVLMDFIARHSVFIRVEGETWAIPLEGATIAPGRLFTDVPETERGTLLTVATRSAFVMDVALVETASAAGAVNQRLNTGRREIVLRAGDSLFTAVEPAGPGDDIFAGLLARSETTVTATAMPITLTDLSQRSEVARDRFVSGIRLVTGGRLEVDVQDRYGRSQPLSADDLERLVVISRMNGGPHRFRLNDGTYANGTYTIGGSAALRDQILFALNFGPDGAASVTTLVVDTTYYTLDHTGTALGANDGDFFELSLRPGLVPRSRTVRYQVTLPDVRDALSVFDVAAAADLRGQYLAADPVGDGTVESVTGVLLIQNDTVGFADLNDGTSYIHRLLIAHSAQASGPNAGRHQIAIIFSEVAGATSPATPPDDAALDGLVLAMRFRRGAEEVIIQYTVDTSDAARDAAGEQAILDHVDLPSGYDNASAPDDFDLAVVDPGRGYDAGTQTLPGTAIPYPRVAYAPARYTRPWAPRDGSEFRVVLNLWTQQRSAVSIPRPNRVRLTLPGSAPLTSGSAAETPGTPILVLRNQQPTSLDDVLLDNNWQFLTRTGADVLVEEIIIGAGGTSLVFAAGRMPTAADGENLAIVFDWGRGGILSFLAGILFRDFDKTNPVQWTAPIQPWRARAMTTLADRNRVRIAIVDVTVPGVDTTTWTWGHDHAGLLPPISPADKIIVTDGIALLDGSDPRDTPLQVVEWVEFAAGVTRYLEADAPGGVVALGTHATWERAIDSRPVFGGWWINPSQSFVTGGPGKQGVTLTGQDYSAVLDRRLHGGGILLSDRGEVPGEFIGRLFKQWQEDLPFQSDEGMVALIQSELGAVMDPPFSTEQAGGTRQSWRQILDAIQERAQGLAGYHVDARKQLVWRDHGIYTGLTLRPGADYQDLEIVEDRSRARNVVDVRTEPESTILVSDEDRLFIEDRARIEGGTGRYEIVADSPEGNAVGEDAARQHASDSLARYPFLFRCTVTIRTHARWSPYGLLATLTELVPGDAFRLTGPHLPELPLVRTTIIGDVLYVEPASASAALPAAVVPGALLEVSGEALEVLDGGGPRGSVWCAIPPGVTVAPAASAPATLIERWLCETIDVEVVPEEGAANMTWTLTGMRPRVGGASGRAQTGYVGRWRELIRGAAR